MTSDRTRGADRSHRLIRLSARGVRRSIFMLGLGFFLGQPSVATPRHTADPQPLAVKVMIVNLFQLEAKPWIDALRPSRTLRIAGLPADDPFVKCTSLAVCQVTTGMGHSNAAASMMAILFSSALDLRRTYFLVAGIAGIDPARGTLGSAAWARYVIDAGIAHEIDAREMPSDWPFGLFGVLTNSPQQKPKLEYGSEVFELDAGLLANALALSRGATLEDSAALAQYRSLYPDGPANQPPSVVQCDTLSGDTWWVGDRLGERARRWTQLLTDGRGVYCTTQQEDNALMTAFTRGAQSGRMQLQRVAVLRSGSDFDRPYPGQSTLDSLRVQLDLDGAVRIAALNLVRAGMPLIQAIVADWPVWRSHAPPPPGSAMSADGS